MTAMIDLPSLVAGMSDDEYRADPVPGGSLSSTGAKAILKSPAHYRWQIDHPRQSTAFDIGHAVHALVLGVGMTVEVLDFDSYRTKAAQQARDEAASAGLAPILSGDYQPIVDMAEAVATHPGAIELFERDGAPEVSAFACDPETGVWLRARPDFLPDPGAGPTPIVDLKTSISADPKQFTRSAAEYGYDIQAELYRHVVSLARGDSATEFRFVVVEKTPPHLVSVVELDAEYAAIGRQRMRRAIETYRRCRETDEWPGYGAETHLIAPPRWLAYEEDMVI